MTAEVLLLSAAEVSDRVRRAMVAGPAGLVVMAAVVYSDPHLPDVMILGSLLALSIIIAVPSPSGRRYNLSTIVVCAAPAVLSADGQLPVRPSVAFLAGATVTVFAFVSLGYRGVRGAAAKAVAYVALGTVMLLAFWLSIGPATALVDGDPVRALIVAGIVTSLVWYSVDLLFDAFTQAARRDQSVRLQLIRRSADWAVVVALLTSAILLGLAWLRMSWWWSVLVAGVPYLIAHIGFLSSQAARRTYTETIQTLSRIPEVAGITSDGHGVRTADLSHAIAERIEMLPADQADLEFAALLHDIGRLTLRQPAIVRRGFTEEDIARWGSTMIAEAPHLLEVAHIVACQHEPYRQPGQRRNDDLPRAAQIIRVASAFDHALAELGFTPIEALESLHRGAAYDYDPEIVAALRTVLENPELLRGWAADQFGVA